jgi:hypothetical protein
MRRQRVSQLRAPFSRGVTPFTRRCLDRSGRNLLSPAPFRRNHDNSKSLSIHGGIENGGDCACPVFVGSDQAVRLTCNTPKSGFGCERSGTRCAITIMRRGVHACYGRGGVSPMDTPNAGRSRWPDGGFQRKPRLVPALSTVSARAPAARRCSSSGTAGWLHAGKRPAGLFSAIYREPNSMFSMVATGRRRPISGARHCLILPD